MLAYVIFIPKIFQCSSQSFFFFLPILLAYKIRSCKIISSLNLRLRERKSDCCWRSKFPLIVCFLNQLLIAFLILIFYVYVLLEIYRRLLWLMIFIVFMFVFFSLFFSFFLFKESFLRNPSLTHENCLAAFCPTVYGQNQVKKEVISTLRQPYDNGKGTKRSIKYVFFFFFWSKKRYVSYIYIHTYIYIFL